MTKFLNIDTDNSLGGSSASDVLVASQKAVKDYVDAHSGGLPTQTGHAGEFLTTDGSVASWSGAIGYHPGLFAYEWDDHLRNDVQWLRADTFSWQDGSVYEAAYNHLVDEASGLSGQSETIAGITVWFVVAADGHKICPASEESNVTAIYNATGVAWYYIIDTTNTRFKLPRVNADKEEALIFESALVDTTSTNHTAGSTPLRLGSVGTSTSINNGSSNPICTYGDNGIGANSANGGWGAQRNQLAPLNLESDLSTGISSYFAGKKYLYFYVGNFTQTAIENTAGLNASLFNGKVDLDGSNATFPHIIESNTSGSVWYRKYSDGWVEQFGVAVGTGSATATRCNLAVPMADSNYCITYGPTTADILGVYLAAKTTTYFDIVTGQGGIQYKAGAFNWMVCGMAA